MKKISTFVICLILCVATYSQAMQPISNDEMDQVRGQSGVSLTVDDYAFYHSFEQRSIRDLDGKGEAGGAELNINDMEFDVLRVNAISPNEKVGTKEAHFDISDSDAIDDFEPSPFVLDVTDEIPVISPTANWAFTTLNAVIPLKMPAEVEEYNNAGIYFELPTISIYADEISIGSVTVNSIDRSAINDGQSFGSLSVKGFNLAILDGMGDLHANSWYDQHGSSDDGTTDFKKGSGIYLTVDDVRMYAHIDQIRYDDPGGLVDRVEDSRIGGPGAVAINDLEANEIRMNAILAPDMQDIIDLLDLALAGEVDISGLMEGELTAVYSEHLGIMTPGEDDLHLDNMDHLKVVSMKLSDPFRNADSFWDYFNIDDRIRDALDLRDSWIGRPVWLDVTNDLPRATASHQSNGGTGTIAGLRTYTGTLETYVNKLSMSGMEFIDPKGQAVNDGSSLMKTEINDLVWAQLGGTMEVAPH